jgi:hypothetical protein
MIPAVRYGAADLLFSLKLYRKKFVTTALAVVSVFLLGANISNAAHKTRINSTVGIEYRAQLGQDLDGDHIPETATIRQRRNLYQVSIHFTTGHPKLRLSAYITEGLAGLSFEARDVNNDNKGDLVLVSATSLRPIAIWINKGRATFQQANSSLYSRVGKYTGPTYHFRGTSSQPEPVGNLAIDRFPEATPAVKYFTVHHDITALFAFQVEQRPFGSLSRQVPPRGPPSTTHA